MVILYQVPSLGGTPRRILADVDSPISFSPDGKRFSFVRECQHYENRQFDDRECRRHRRANNGLTASARIIFAEWSGMVARRKAHRHNRKSHWENGVRIILIRST